MREIKQMVKNKQLTFLDNYNAHMNERQDMVIFLCPNRMSHCSYQITFYRYQLFYPNIILLKKAAQMLFSIAIFNK